MEVAKKLTLIPTTRLFGGRKGPFTSSIAPPSSPSVGYRTATATYKENGTGGVGGRIIGDTWIFTILVWGSGLQNTRYAGFEDTFEADYQVEFLWEASTAAGTAYIAVCKGKSLVAEASTANWLLSDEGSIVNGMCFANKHAFADYNGIYVDGVTLMDYFTASEEGNTGERAVTRRPELGANKMQAATLSIPENHGYFHVLTANNDTILSGPGYTFHGINTSTGVDRTFGTLWMQNGGAPNDNVPFDFSGPSNVIHMVSPRIVVPGPKA